MSTLDLTRPFAGYAYAYPHKTAYRPLEPARPLREVWADEDRSHLFAYVHVPYCTMRCGFCNLFTVARAGDVGEVYVDALGRQIDATARALGDARLARLALGGGTPTYLEAGQLQRLFDRLARAFGAPLETLPSSVECSPETASMDRLEVLARWRVRRLSMGVQSFHDDEVRRLGRVQRRAEVEEVVRRARQLGFPRLNLDLIYGIEGQTETSFLQSVEAAIGLEAEEVYLYPLYVRPLTGLGRRAQRAEAREHDARRSALYEMGRARLAEAGYRQRSMRAFHRLDESDTGPPYRCQDDGMIGLGSGARSYTRRLHYSFDYAVGRSETQAILDGYMTRTEEAFARVEHGFPMSADEARRRFVIQSLLDGDGLERAAYRERFGTAVDEDLPQLADLQGRDWVEGAEPEAPLLRLRGNGWRYADALGPWLYSAPVRAAMGDWAPR